MLTLGESKGVEESCHLVARHIKEVALHISHWVNLVGVPVPSATEVKKHLLQQILHLCARLDQGDISAFLLDVIVKHVADQS